MKQCSKRVPSAICLLAASASLLAACASLLAACAVGPSAAAPDTVLVPIAAQEELRGDPELEARLALLDPRMREHSSGRVLAFQLANTSAEPLRLFLAIDWYDRHGRPAGAARRAWIPLELDARGTREVAIPVPAPEAETWRWHATADPRPR